ncbi:cell envelope integrity protein TolA [Brevundimonas sp. SL130]|uniref:cell envelope integrity protein TolA n=1 Tax=Brevundimonas sp. SL130 TaxID=2995143 RepID=UPI00226CD3CC|nr:cell envelope integrity protein TolA [Brevundimonas sp. SL130]WAC60351.1 cell envelope integrity protein TolA [Brevundimonas sp. SL130]
MRRPGSSESWPAILGSIALHAGVVALAFVSFSHKAEDAPPLVHSVPVSIVSETVIEAAAADNPQPEPSPDDAATAPVSAPETPTPPVPQPTPPPPTPTPAPPRPTPRPTPAPRPTPPRPSPPTPEKARPTPPRPTPPTPARPAPKRNEPSLDLDALAGPTRNTNQRGRPATGQQGAGSASQATGPQVTAIFNQVYPNWVLPCDIPGADQLRIQVELTLSPDGRITRGPTLINPQSSSVYRAAADGALRALRQTAPFDVPEGFPGGAYRPTFNTERACRNR